MSITQAFTGRRPDLPDDDDLAERLPIGYRDPKSPNYVPPELRRAVVDFDPGIVARMRDSLIIGVKDQVLRGRHVITPRNSAGELETAVLWLTIDRVRADLAAAAGRAVRDERDRSLYGCRSCGVVSVTTALNTGTRRHRLVDGTAVVVCERCYPVAEQQALARLGAEQVNGRARAELVATLLEATP